MSEMTSRDLLERLIGFETVSRDSNLALIEFIRDCLAQWPVRHTAIHARLFLADHAHVRSFVHHWLAARSTNAEMQPGV
ncbi:hypothetical protein [Caballeronia sp. J97]|uniref:hypothetical protein n=1 Tax=Caballeronia sp. J97 TaxID=2805429 RepID=UPI002AAF6FD9|nr:hypothetical protein [Caballeronia sp. J97]